jgi:hypothetical protein
MSSTGCPVQGLDIGPGDTHLSSVVRIQPVLNGAMFGGVVHERHSPDLPVLASQRGLQNAVRHGVDPLVRARTDQSTAACFVRCADPVGVRGDGVGEGHRDRDPRGARLIDLAPRLTHDVIDADRGLPRSAGRRQLRELALQIAANALSDLARPRRPVGWTCLRFEP